MCGQRRRGDGGAAGDRCVELFALDLWRPGGRPGVTAGYWLRATAGRLLPLMAVSWLRPVASYVVSPASARGNGFQFRGSSSAMRLVGGDQERQHIPEVRNRPVNCIFSWSQLP